MFTFCGENKSLIGQSTTFFSVKTGFEELKNNKQNLVKKNICWSTKFSDPTNELEYMLQ